jgi:hypothetical protein
MLHSAETIDLTFAHGLVSSTTRIAVPGGWLYSGATAVFVPDPRAPHVRDARRLGLIDGWEFDDLGSITTWYRKGGNKNTDAVIRLFKDSRWHVIAWHADKSFTQHATLLEAHDALVASGSESPFAVATGSAKVEGGAA